MVTTGTMILLVRSESAGPRGRQPQIRVLRCHGGRRTDLRGRLPRTPRVSARRRARRERFPTCGHPGPMSSGTQRPPLTGTCRPRRAPRIDKRVPAGRSLEHTLSRKQPGRSWLRLQHDGGRAGPVSVENHPVAGYEPQACGVDLSRPTLAAQLTYDLDDAMKPPARSGLACAQLTAGGIEWIAAAAKLLSNELGYLPARDHA